MATRQRRGRRPAGTDRDRTSLVDAERLWSVYQPLSRVLAIGAGAALIVGWLRPTRWILALRLVVVLGVVWTFAVLRFLRADAWGDAAAGVD